MHLFVVIRSKEIGCHEKWLLISPSAAKSIQVPVWATRLIGNNKMIKYAFLSHLGYQDRLAKIATFGLAQRFYRGTQLVSISMALHQNASPYVAMRLSLFCNPIFIQILLIWKMKNLPIIQLPYNTFVVTQHRGGGAMVALSWLTANLYCIEFVSNRI